MDVGQEQLGVAGRRALAAAKPLEPDVGDLGDAIAIEEHGGRVEAAVRRRHVTVVQVLHSASGCKAGVDGRVPLQALATRQLAGLKDVEEVAGLREICDDDAAVEDGALDRHKVRVAQRRGGLQERLEGGGRVARRVDDAHGVHGAVQLGLEDLTVGVLEQEAPAQHNTSRFTGAQ